MIGVLRQQAGYVVGVKRRLTVLKQRLHSLLDHTPYTYAVQIDGTSVETRYHFSLTASIDLKPVLAQSEH